MREERSDRTEDNVVMSQRSDSPPPVRNMQQPARHSPPPVIPQPPVASEGSLKVTFRSMQEGDRVGFVNPSDTIGQVKEQNFGQRYVRFFC